MPGTPIRLTPRAGRVALFFVAAIGGIVAPTAAGFVLGFLGPPPYVLEKVALTPEWQGTTRRPDGVTVEITMLATADEANERADDLMNDISTRSHTRTLHIHRYTTREEQRRGLVVPVADLVIRIEGENDAQVDRALESLPFVVKNPKKNLVYALFTDHLGGFFLGLGLYIVAYSLAWLRTAAWAARIDPPAGATPIPAEELRAKLLAVNSLDLPFEIREGKRGALIAAWKLADAKWTGLFEKGGLTIARSVKLVLDPERCRVRTTDFSKTIRWSAGLARATWSFSCFRGISFFEFQAGAAYGLLLEDGRWKFAAAYRYAFNLNELKQPLVEAILGSGWIYQPVLTFVKPLGG